MAPPKILLCGDVSGNLKQLFKRVVSVNKSAGPFDALFCVGQFFPDSADQLDEFTGYIEGRAEIPLPTYFIGDYGVGATKFLLAATKDSGNQGFKMDGLKVCSNLYWMKGSGKFTFHGLSVVYLSGLQSSDSQQFGTYSQDDVDALRAIAEDPGIVDLFLTNKWPSGITNKAGTSDVPPGASEPFGTDSTVAELAAEIKPRYHVAGTKGMFYAREPYSNVDAVHVTRFIGLAPVGNKDKQKFLHALSPTPASTMSALEIKTKSPNTTLSPYMYIEGTANAKEGAKRSSDSVSDSDSQYWRYDVSQKRQKHGAGDGNRLCFKFVSSGSCPRGETCNFQHDMDAREQSLRGVCFDFMNKGKCERGTDCKFKHSIQDEGESNSHKRRTGNATRSTECWFCLSSSKIESHLFISLGEHYYCALAKGPLVEDHVLLIPIGHSPNTLSLPSECEMELGKFQDSLKKFYKKQDKEVVFFEWASKRSTHANLQVVPIPSAKAASVQNLFHLAADRFQFKFTTTKFSNSSDGRKSLRTQFDRNFSFFYAELPDGTVLSHLIEESENFLPQFGREVMAGLLNKANRADWRRCTDSKEEETKMVEKFKSRFEEFDPNN
ncbi:zinc finger CCCH domain-containing protein 64-like [Rosa rugosa]|uniref:zinc finger CCCH domain-containing protein 64-like n=1 Tax=Rosa rugosa TaxID=74645 RepID=UPI002B415076|nr:zinc finger CCCH domain-containing protein 64-like [Rosa rugosa]